MATLNTKIILLNGIQAEWSQLQDYVLSRGEPAVEFVRDIGSESTTLNAVKVKIGDGFTSYKNLPYVGEEIADNLASLVLRVNGLESEIDDNTSAIEALQTTVSTLGNAVFEIEGATLDTKEGETEADKIASYVTEDVKEGNIAIVKRELAGGKFSYTAYVFNGENWAAMDGNYSAANVYTSSKITLAGDYGKDSRNDAITSIGNKRIGDVIEAGTSLQSLLMDMLSQRLQPGTPTAPSATIIFTNKNASGQNDEVEIGTTYTPKYKTTFSDGKFTYNEVTGCTSTEATVSFDGKTTTIAANALDGATGSMDSVVINNTTKKVFTLTYGYTASTVDVVDNLGDPATQNTSIAAASGKTATSTHGVTGFRYAFGGSSTAKSLDVTSNNIRALVSKTKSSNASFDVTIAEGANFVMIAVPDGRKITKVADANAFGTDIFSEFTQVEGTVQVGGADATADSIGNYATAYNVWTYAPKASLSANTYTVTIANE